MSQIRTGHYISGGGSKNLALGFVPSYLKLWNESSGANEVFCIEWFAEMGAAKQIEWKRLADNGSTGGYTVGYAGSGGSVQAYDAASVTVGPPVVVSGGKGVTIDTGWVDDNDVIYYLAILADRDVDGGDESP